MPGIPPAAPVAPWHMWGSSQQVSLTQTVAGGAPAQTMQLARVNYRRPETWSFWLAARLTGGDVNPGPGALVVEANVQVLFGVGRSIFRSEDQGQFGFARFLWSLPALVSPGGNLNNNKYTTRVNSVVLNDVDATSFQPIDHIVAQDIQCWATFSILSVPVGNSVSAELTAFFAPRVHVRPDWFTELGEDVEVNEAIKYLGTERGGT